MIKKSYIAPTLEKFNFRVLYFDKRIFFSISIHQPTMSILEEDVFIITWRVSSFSMCADECIESPVIRIKKFGNSEWKLRLCPKNGDFISCILICVSLGAYESSIPMFFELSVNTPLPFEKDAADFKLNSSDGYNTWILIEDVLRDKDKYLPNDTLTVICQMKCKNLRGLQNSEEEIFETLSRVCSSSISINECCIETIIPVQTKRSLWRIPRFDLLAVGKRITLPVFSAVKESPSFYVSLYKDVESIIRIEIRREMDNQGKNIFMKCSVFVVNPPKEFDPMCHEDEFFLESDQVWKFPAFLKWNSDDGFICTSACTCEVYLQFDFAFSIEGKLLHFEKPNWGPGFVPLVSKIPPKALTTQTPEDAHPVVSFRVDDQTFKVHKSVLKARSEVFFAMFENDMKEKATGVVDIPDEDPLTWGQLVAFLYLGSLDPDDLLSTDIKKLYAVAQKYQVLSLIDYSSYLLTKSMTVLNVGENLILADLYQDNRFLKSAIDFVNLHSDRILTSEMWKNLMENNPSLAANIMHKLLVKGSY